MGRVLITVGDANGIGPEVAAKAAIALCENAALRPVIVGDRHLMNPFVRAGGFEIETDPESWGRSGSVDLFDVPGIDAAEVTPGTPTAASGRATIAYVEQAVALVKKGVGRAIVAAPHSETAVNASGRRFSGYPNLLSELAGTGEDSIFLMLIGGGLRIVHVTLHEGISGALARLTPDLIARATLAADLALKGLGVAAPRIGLFGINPHAGEGGLFGDEDDRIVVPALERLRAQGVDVHGPEGADVMLGRAGYDAFVAMYHDQGHIPVKLLAGRGAAAMSIGAGLVFSSVGHGAAFDIAGKGQASPDAVVAAVRLVGEIQ
ncbi:PdxA family dehydrogenase [Pelagibacterium halotolerans]|uniref:4-hydroxythreonine-4-phosphate dehydrogenase n=1 Tax=Pelagibacterium halotolerans (strain DSM 22347 / JCM 15775 / CGMCC 1.7692 / B2) TaxID=1082931 RepID=G4RBH1_PELHB|nr:4-hydroxythreonine-4-phosphate dehydrogenase PdxA [Pelagibacterium halotolerans]AEQ52647.1 4-hydroxythreonine-4-phosphate dehydrogenase [Pelagibacterium halotolerans B2]QJR17649.1 terephthalate dihydrodiol dehydrogenase [Pelagibacterium halotolerans]SEA83762.1 4-hydroxythreonine-4-phosphate dehydrogenase [Pelagibacterium halotolerans]